jgi:hypothetical protein
MMRTILDKNQARGTKFFYMVNPAELETFDEMTEYLESILHGPCAVWDEGGDLILLEIRARVAMVHGMKIVIYPKEHHPPHFHVKTATINASFRIDDCSLLSGEISSAEYDKIRFWHQYSKNELIDRWNSLRPSTCTVGPYKDS